MLRIRREYNYSDVYLLPKKTIVGSRSECDTSVKFGPKTFKMPVVPANMKSVVNEETCKFLAENGWFYVMHRFGINTLNFVENMHNNNLFASISIGVNEDTYRELKYLEDCKTKVEYMTLDVANAWCPKAEKMVKYVKSTFPDTFLIVGNMATPEAVREIESWGADCVKIGIGPGKACTTKLKTGFTRPMISCLLECVPEAGTPVIADGGIVEHGDIAKALACGATMVMAGSMFSGYDQSASEIIEINGTKKAIYFGSASEHNKGKYNHVEGKKIFEEYKGDMSKLLIELQEDLRSSISYAGGKNLAALSTCELITIN
jgi:GMP reductase